MIHDPKEVRAGLKELLADANSTRDRQAIRAAIQLISTMQADLRRLGMNEYNDESTE